MSKADVICDLANKELLEVPKTILDMTYLRMLYLENNSIIKLPENFFKLLPDLTWLDLRNNKLQCLPEEIGEHKKLQNLLLQNNLLVRLPDELGLVDTLKVLQISGNQIIYPSESVQLLGISYIMKYLKEQYYFKENVRLNEDAKKPTTKVAAIKSNKSKDKIPVKDVLRQLSKSRLIKSQLPAINVKSLSKPESAIDENELTDELKSKKVHKVTKTCSKLSVQSHYSNKYLEKKVRNKEVGIHSKELKETWLNKLRDLITDQQKILQQEKNLTALSEWRLDKKLKPAVKPASFVKSQPPYDVNKEFDRILSRKDLSQPIQKLIKQRTPAGHKQVDIERFVSEVVAQLKKIETEQKTKKCSEDDIRTILDLQKKISTLKSLNDRY